MMKSLSFFALVITLPLLLVACNRPVANEQAATPSPTPDALAIAQQKAEEAAQAAGEAAKTAGTAAKEASKTALDKLEVIADDVSEDLSATPEPSATPNSPEGL